jgi:hypothetical protein
MKKIIFALIISLITIFAFSSTAKAQYIDDNTFANNSYIRTKAMVSSAQWQRAIHNEKAGKTMFYCGIAAQVVGSGLLFVPAYKHEVWYEYDSYCEYNSISGIGVICNIVGGAAIVAGSITEIVGICKWSNAAAAKRKMVVEYGLGTLLIRF